LRAIAQNGTQRDSRAEAAVMTKSVLNDQQVPLSTLPPSPTQKRFALAIVLVLFAAFCATVPFATVPLPYFREFAAMFVISSITSALLFVQFSLVHSRALLAISCSARS
jgi:two-component system, sensor histidine kinase and response regulator